MPRSQGVYSLPAGNPVATGTTIEADWANSTMQDVATALTNSIARDGSTAVTSNLQMSGFRHTGVGDASARTHYGVVSQIQDGAYSLAGSVAGTDTVTGSLSPSISAYANGMCVRLFPANTNTGAVTLALNGLTARAVVKFNSVALVAGDLIAGVPADVVYDLANTQWVLLNPQAGIAPPNSISNAMLRQSAGLSIIGRSANTTGDVADITAASDGQVLRRSGTSIGFGQVDLASANAVTGTLPDASLSTNVPLKNAGNIFTGSTQTISSTAPRIHLHESDAGVDEKYWRILAQDDRFRIDLLDDAQSVGETAINILRDGFTVSSVAVSSDLISFNGAADFNGSVSMGGNLTVTGTFSILGSGETLATFVDDGAVTLYHNNVTALRSATLANGGAEVNNTLTGGGFERVLTATDRGLATRSTSATLTAGQVHARSAGTTINTGLTAGSWVGIQNTSASDITLTQGAGLTLRMTGTTATGNRTLVAHGRAMVWANTSTEYYISGDIS